jgi:hypothetical protein
MAAASVDPNRRVGITLVNDDEWGEEAVFRPRCRPRREASRRQWGH